SSRKIPGTLRTASSAWNTTRRFALVAWYGAKMASYRFPPSRTRPPICKSFLGLSDDLKNNIGQLLRAFPEKSLMGKSIATGTSSATTLKPFNNSNGIGPGIYHHGRRLEGVGDVRPDSLNAEFVEAAPNTNSGNGYYEWPVRFLYGEHDETAQLILRLGVV
ncbi:hypothetical protein F5Y06DRAFT_308335, partial [Hypoxylon sp. FL0890]